MVMLCTYSSLRPPRYFTSVEHALLKSALKLPTKRISISQTERKSFLTIIVIRRDNHQFCAFALHSKISRVSRKAGPLLVFQTSFSKNQMHVAIHLRFVERNEFCTREEATLPASFFVKILIFSRQFHGGLTPSRGLQCL